MDWRPEWGNPHRMHQLSAVTPRGLCTIDQGRQAFMRTAGKPHGLSPHPNKYCPPNRMKLRLVWGCVMVIAAYRSYSDLTNRESHSIPKHKTKWGFKIREWPDEAFCKHWINIWMDKQDCSGLWDKADICQVWPESERTWRPCQGWWAWGKSILCLVCDWDQCLEWDLGSIWSQTQIKWQNYQICASESSFHCLESILQVWGSFLSPSLFFTHLSVGSHYHYAHCPSNTCPSSTADHRLPGILSPVPCFTPNAHETLLQNGNARMTQGAAFCSANAILTPSTGKWGSHFHKETCHKTYDFEQQYSTVWVVRKNPQLNHSLFNCS